MYNYMDIGNNFIWQDIMAVILLTWDTLDDM